MDLDKILADYTERAAEIPFGNSDYQNIVFVGAIQGTPSRACRAWLIRLSDRIEAYRDAEFGLKLHDIKMRKILRKLSVTTDDLKREELQLKMDRESARRFDHEKMRCDCEREIEALHRAVMAFPAFPRAQFELDEADHWEQAASAQLQDGQNHGAMETLRAMNLFLPQFEEFIGNRLGVGTTGQQVTVSLPQHEETKDE